MALQLLSRNSERRVLAIDDIFGLRRNRSVAARRKNHAINELQRDDRPAGDLGNAAGRKGSSADCVDGAAARKWGARTCFAKLSHNEQGCGALLIVAGLSAVKCPVMLWSSYAFFLLFFLRVLSHSLDANMKHRAIR